mmetsp:Transcript_1801/g.5869  ORF Transcript_1801/g.5869 Transcript_1801/m.5869 type:complete len:105 (+) Transcript_1801:1-315(+)
MAGSSRAGALGPHAPIGQDEEEPVPIDQLPAGALARLKRALGDLVARNHGETSFAIATVFAALDDAHTAAGIPPPTMGELKAALLHEGMGAEVMYSEGTVYILG